MRTPLYTVKLLYSNPLKWRHLSIQWNLYSNSQKWGHLCIQWNPSIPTSWNQDRSVYSETPWGHLCIQWKISWNGDTSVYSGTPLFQPPETRTPLYTVELLYSNPLKWRHLSIQWNLYSNSQKWGHLCIQWNPSIPTSWNQDRSVYSETPWGHLCIQWKISWNEDTFVYSGTLYSNPQKWRHLWYPLNK